MNTRALLTLLLPIITECAAAIPLAAAEFRPDSHERIALLATRDAGAAQVHVVTRPGRIPVVAAEVLRIGGSIRYRADEIDYLRALLPLADTGSLDAFAAHPAIEAISVSHSGEKPPVVLKPAEAHTDAEAREGDEPHLPLIAPYRPRIDLDAEEFQRRHPTYDGRGVVIAGFDNLPDILHRNLQRALDVSGRLVPKFAAAEVTGHPDDDRTDTNWVRMSQQVTATGGQFTLGDVTYRAPFDGKFRFGLLARPQLGSVRLFVPLPGKTDNEPAQIPVLWHEGRATAWVDTSLDNSFADERAVRPFALAGEYGVFGVDDPATLRRETVAFTVSVELAAKAVRINPCWAGHGTMVAGVAVGESFAPGLDALAGMAQLAAWQNSSVWDSYTLVESAHRALTDPRTDVAYVEQHVSQFTGNRRKDGRDAFTLALDRLAAHTQRLIFVPATNHPGLSQTDEPSLGRQVISVQAYEGRGSLKLTAGVGLPPGDYLHSVGAFGPSGDGALKPELMAPSGHLGTEPEFYNSGFRRFPGNWKLPYGLGIGGGTSSAAPTAAAAAALLISASKQEGVRWEADRLKAALFSTARFCTDIPAYQQGRGLIQVGRAWELLKKLHARPDWHAPDIEVRAPVRTMVSAHLMTPHHGRGLYEREGWTAGDKGEREIVFTRRNGPAEPVTYAVEWLGDTRSFRSAAEIVLPLNEPVALRVAVFVPDPRVHSALLRLREPGDPVEAVATLATIVAAEPVPTDGTAFTRKITVPRPGTHGVHVTVPAGAKRLEVKLHKDSPETINVMRHAPDFRGYDLKIPLRGFTTGELDVSIDDPSSGTWEVLLINRAFQSDVMWSKLIARSPEVRERGWGMGLQMEPRPNPLTPTEVEVEIRIVPGAK